MFCDIFSIFNFLLNLKYFFYDSVILECPNTGWLQFYFSCSQQIDKCEKNLYQGRKVLKLSIWAKADQDSALIIDKPTICAACGIGDAHSDGTHVLTSSFRVRSISFRLTLVLSIDFEFYQRVFVSLCGCVYTVECFTVLCSHVAK